MIAKFTTFIAIAAVVAQSVVAIDEAETEREIGLLMGHEKVFSQFCLDSLDYVKSDITRQVNEGASQVYLAFFSATTEIADEVLTVEKQAVAELAKQVQSQDTQTTADQVSSDAPLPEEKILSLIEQGKRRIQESKFVGRLVAATQTAAQVLANTAESAIFRRIARVRSIMGQQSLVEGIKSACHLAENYQARMIENLENTRNELAKVNQEPEVQEYIRGAQIQSLKCFTPRTITRISAFCELLKNGAGAFMKMLGLDYTKVNFNDVVVDEAPVKTVV